MLYKPQIKTKGHCIKVGNVVVAQKISNDKLLSRSVILILENNSTGTIGVILNKTNLLSETISTLTNKKIQYGGAHNTHYLLFIHSIKNLPKSIPIADELFYTEDFDEVENAIRSNPQNAHKIRSFLGFTIWNAGKLNQEIAENRWRLDDLKPDELFLRDGNDFWGHKLLKCGNIYGLFHTMNDPILS